LGDDASNVSRSARRLVAEVDRVATQQVERDESAGVSMLRRHRAKSM
jgi:hypothetical protein